VLCIGNYFRAKRAQERQKQRRETKQQQAAGAGSASNMERGLHKGGGGGADYQAPVLPQGGGASGRLL